MRTIDQDEVNSADHLGHNRICCVTHIKSMPKEFYVGQAVQLIGVPPYLKTADPMPMLRPANLVQAGETGTVLSRHPGGYWGVRFTKGAFLLDDQYLEAVAPGTNLTLEQGQTG